MTRSDAAVRPSEPQPADLVQPALQDSGDFESRPPPSGDPDAFIVFCASLLAETPLRSDFWEQRRKDRCQAEFDLERPERVPASYPREFLDELFRLCAKLRAAN